MGIIFFRKEFKNQTAIINAIIIPITGASTIKPTILSITGELITEKLPAPATAAPVNPPINVCEELDGIPYHQVIKFQMMAAIRPARITVSPISPFTVLAIVLPTP